MPSEAVPSEEGIGATRVATTKIFRVKSVAIQERDVRVSRLVAQVDD